MESSRPPRASRWTILVATLGTFAGCQADAELTTEHGEPIEVRRIDSAPVWTLGADFGGPEVTFVRPMPMTLPGGRIVVADPGTRQVHYFGADRQHLATVGGDGDGPREFRDIATLAVYPPDSLLLFDRQLQRFTILDADGDLGRTGPLRGFTGAGVGPLREVHPLADGRLVGRGTITATTAVGGGLWRDSLALVLFDRTGENGRIIARLAGDDRYAAEVNSARTVNNHPLGRIPAIATRDTEILYAGGTDARVVILSPAGGRRGSITHEVPKKPVTDERLARLRSLWLEGVEAEDTRRQMRELLEAIEYPESLPVTARMVVDGGNRVWLERYRLDPSEPARWMVFDTTAAVVEVVELPADFRLTQAGEDFLLGVRTTELGTQVVQRLPFRPHGD